jgi:hypothetical protein
MSAVGISHSGAGPEMSSAHTVRMPDDHCPHCGHIVSAASNLREKLQPAPDDLALCIECGEWNAFDEGLRLRKPTPDELVEANNNPDFRNYRDTWVKTFGSKE